MAVWQFLKKLETELLYEPAILLLGIYLKELKVVSQRYLHIHAHSSTIHNNQEVEAIQVSINE